MCQIILFRCLNLYLCLYSKLSPTSVKPKSKEMKPQHHGELSSDSESDLGGDVKTTAKSR